jgi:hypothetical protein
VTINKRLPVMAGDEIVFLHPQGPSAPLTWNVDQKSGRLAINVPDSEVSTVDYAWAFQVQYKID